MTMNFGSLAGLGGRADPPGPAAATILRHLGKLSEAQRVAIIRQLGWDRDEDHGGTGLMADWFDQTTGQQTRPILWQTVSNYLHGFMGGSFGKRPIQRSEIATGSLRWAAPADARYYGHYTSNGVRTDFRD